MYQTVFSRYELKYRLNTAQKERILTAMERYMLPDPYGRTTVRNLYFDTDTYLLIRRSMEKPIFKEKLRLRSYTCAGEEDTVFAELKRKYDGVVYKRRLALPREQATDFLTTGNSPADDSQIAREIHYFCRHYGKLRPTVFLAYDREAFYSRTDNGFRVTFDENIRARNTDLSLGAQPYGTSLMASGESLMEIKCSGGIPLWMTDLLSAEHLYKTSYSKYGSAYQKLVFPEWKNRQSQKKTEEIHYVS